MASLLGRFVTTFSQGLRRQPSAHFLTRNPMRDERTDIERLDRLKSAIGQIVTEIDAERRGLECRYGRECQDAAFLMDAMENDGRANAPSKRLNSLTRSILDCERRLARLSLQGDLIRQLQQSLEQNVSDRWWGNGFPADRIG